MFEDESHKRHFWKFFGIFLLIIFLGLAFQVGLGVYIQHERELTKNIPAEVKTLSPK